MEKAFFESRIRRTGADRAPLGGIEAGGYRLAYADKPSEAQVAGERVSGTINAAFSIGLTVNADGSIVDVLPQKPAGKAGAGPGMRIVAVNDRKFSGDILREEIRNGVDAGALELTLANGKTFSKYKIEYRGGKRYPVLQRNGRPPLLDQILEPLK